MARMARMDDIAVQYLFCDFRDFCVTFILDIALQYLFRISFVISGSFGIQRKSVESGRSVVFLLFGIPFIFRKSTKKRNYTKTLDQ